MERITISGPVAVTVAFLLLAAGASWSSGQATGQTSRPLIPSVYGRDLFDFSCATCHGRDGKGGGPTAPALKVAPPDLTTIAKRHGGTFPKASIEALVAGRGDRRPTSHGSTEMPVWGPIFRALDASHTTAETRIASLVAYLESIQEGK